MADIASASSSSSAQPEVEIVEPSALPIQYQVFINHRGPNVKKTLASVIYHTLQRIGIRVFLDKNEMERGESIWAQIEAAIRSSSVHVAIFSPNYADSRWCLEELCLMMQHPLKILPVFYDVQPSDLRWLEKDGPYAEAMRVHQNKGRYDSQTITKWKKTLIAVADISGYEFKESDGDEGEAVNTIVNNVLGRVKKEEWDVAKYPTGLNEVAKDFAVTMSQMNRDHSEKVIVEGIVGMGGIGKTTLATHIFNTERSNYRGSCFLPDIRSHNSLTDLQSVLLKDLTGVEARILSVNQGIGIFRDRLSSCRALIILDNIDGINQLDALLVVRDVLPPGSRIVITSRDKGLLQRSGISRLYNIRPLNIRPLSNQHARQLFCWHAFGKPSPVEGFEDLVESFLEVCGGLPLSLKVLGALLCGNDDRDYWQCQLDRVSQRMEADIKERLKISYDALEENCQEMFLDVASFFIGEEKDMAVRIWDGCGWHGLIGVVTLEQRCFLEFDSKGCIRMHDHLRDLGTDIIDDQALKDPQKPRRLWRPGDIEDLLKQPSTQGTQLAIRGVKMLGAPRDDGRTGRRWMQPLRRFWRCFSFRVSGLALLDIEEGVSVKGILGRKSKDIRWLRWRRCPYKSLPSWLPMENLRVLQLDEGSPCETLWDDFKQFPAQLRELNVHNCTLLSRCPKSIGDLKHLEKIVLNNSRGKSLPEEFCRLRSLKHLELRYWGKLQELPKNFGELTNLQRLDLRLCRRLRTLPRSFSGLIQLCHLDLGYCSQLIIPADILGNISTLRHVNFNHCTALEILPSQIIHQTSLQELHLMFSRLKELPENMGNLTSLKELRIVSDLLTRLPENMGNLTSLKELGIGSNLLTRLPPGMWTLANLTKLDVVVCPLLECLGAWECAEKVLGSSSVEHFRGVQQLTNLEQLWISQCRLLREVQPFTNVGSVGEEESMVAFTEPRGRFPKLRELGIRGTNIRKIAISEDVCPNLKQLDLSFNQNLVEIEALPHTLEGLTIRYCPELEKVPHLGGFSALRRIDARSCPKLKRMEGSEQLKGCSN